MNYHHLIVALDNQIQYITINRPEKLNALNTSVLAELASAIADSQTNNEVKAIYITGAGEKAFVAGADITEFQNFSVDEGKHLAENGQKTVFNAIEKSTKPVLAAINGFALGGGLELAMACHLRIASDNAKMGLPEVGLGLIPGYGGTQRLSQLVGKGRALEMIFTGEMIDAERAWQIGLVNHVVKQSELRQKAEEILYKIINKAPLAIASVIKAVNAINENHKIGFSTEINEFAACFSTEDFKEGVSAFIEKRKAIFKGK